MKTIIEARSIRKVYGQLEVLRGIDLDVYEGEIASIVGPSGAGKTTLLQILGTLTSAEPGAHLSICGEAVQGLRANALASLRNRLLGFVFQSHQLLPEFSALENVYIPAMIAGLGRTEASKRAMELLAHLGLEARAQHRPSELSGGECQRVAVARALMNRPAVILADEPSGALDTQNKEALHQLFFDLRDQMGQTFVIVTHDVELAQRTDRMICLRDGQLERIIDHTTR